MVRFHACIGDLSHVCGRCVNSALSGSSVSVLTVLICLYLVSSRLLWAETVVVQNFDYAGGKSTVTCTTVPTRVITTNGATTELMLRLGLSGHLVGTAYLDNPVLPDVQKAYDQIPVLSRRYPNKETVLAREPDLLFGWRTVFGPQALGDVYYWHKLGVQTFISRNTILTPQKITHFYDDLRDIGRMFNVQDRAEDFIAETEKKIELIREQLPPADQRPRVLIAEFADHGRFRAYAEQTLAGDMLSKAGGRNAFPEEGLYSLEHLIHVDPEVIVFVYMLQDQKSVEAQLAAIKEHPILRKIQAVRNDRLYSMPLAEVFSAGVRIPSGIQRLAAYLYPEVFRHEQP